MSEEIPKLHGWITPEYAKEISKDMLKYLFRNSKKDFYFIKKFIGIVENANI